MHKDDASLHARVLRAMAGLYRPALQLTEQRTLQGLNLRGGAGALQVRRVSTQPARSLNRPTSRGACVRHPRLSQAAVASDGDWRQTLFHWRGELRYAPPAPPAVPVGTLT